jgi:hypothetical protein
MSDFIKGASRAALEQGLGMGWGDEAEAWLRSKLGDDSYEQNLKKINQEAGKFSEEHSLLAPTLEFVGGAAPLAASYLIPGGQATAPVTSARTLGALAKLAENPYIRGAVTGAGTGVIAGSGAAGPDKRLEGGIGGAVLGAGLGATIPAAIRGGSGLIDYAKQRINPSEDLINRAALEKMSRALEQSDMDPRHIASRLNKDRRMGVPSVVANVDPSLADLAQAVAQRTGKGARTIENALIGQKLGARERAFGQVSKGLEPGNYYSDLDSIQNAMRTKAAPHYEAAYATGEVSDPTVLSFLDRPQFKLGLAKAKHLLEAEGKTFNTTPVLDAQGNIIGETFHPTVENLDNVKRGIDALIKKEIDTTTGKVSDEGIVYIKEKNKFLNALDDIVPEYKEARAIYKGDAELQDAMRSGLKDWKTMHHEQVGKAVERMSEGEKDAFRTGVSRKLYGDIMNPSNNMNAAQRIIGSPETQQKLKPLFDNEGQYNLFKNALQRESQLFNQSNKILGGASTSKNQQMRQALEENTGAGEHMANAIEGGWTGALTKMATSAIRNAQMTEKTAAKLAEMLMEKDPHKVAAAVKMLEDYANEAAPKLQNLKAAEAGAIGGMTAAIYPSADSGTDNLSIEDAIAAREPARSTSSIEDAIAEREANRGKIPTYTNKD